MTEIFILSMLTGGMARMVTKKVDLMGYRSSSKNDSWKKSTKLGIGLLVGLTDVAVANNTVAIIINGSIAKQLSEKYEVDLRESAAILNIFPALCRG